MRGEEREYFLGCYSKVIPPFVTRLSTRAGNFVRRSRSVVEIDEYDDDGGDDDDDKNLHHQHQSQHFQSYATHTCTQRFLVPRGRRFSLLFFDARRTKSGR